MISTEQIQKLVSALRSKTETAVRENQKVHVPMILEGIKTSRVLVEDGDNTPVLAPTENTKSDDNPINDNAVYFWQNDYLVNVKKFHFDEKWYVAIDSVDYPYKSYGIIKVNSEKIPYTTFEYIMNKKSFISRLDRLVYEGLCEPFMIFVNRKFVNWYDIDVVYDCGDTYLLLHGTQYTYQELKSAKLHMVILPFSVDYIGTEDDDHWQLYYNMLLEYLQDSLYLNDSGKLVISVPTINAVYKTATMVYGVGAWMYTQMRMYYLGLLSDSRIASLKKMNLTYYEYDDSGNVSYTYITKFNALDKDVYDKETYWKICHMDYDQYESRALFRFDSDGTMNQTSGELILALMDEDLYTNYYTSDDEYIYYQQADLKNVLFRENYLVFRDGLFYPEEEIASGIMNTIRITNSDKQKVELFTFCPKDIEVPIWLNDVFEDNYLANIALEYINATTQFTDEDTERIEMVTQCMQMLDYDFSDQLLYSENQQNGFDAIMNFDPKLFNPLYHTNVKSTVLTGTQCNQNLVITYDRETRRGLKIPRYRYKNHETYVMVFLNGELIDTYYKMIAFANFFLIPIESDSFASSDVIEILFFTDINNNEISFYATDNMLETCFSDVDSDDNLLTVDIFEEFIKPEELKLFCDYPANIMEYNGLIPEASDSVSYNISFRKDNDDSLYVYKYAVYDPEVADIDYYSIDDLIAVEPDSGVIPTSEEQAAESKTLEEVDEDNTIIANETEITTEEDINTTLGRDNLYTAVSSRKFIYQRLYVDQMAYRIKLSGRFRFCDNQKQYMLFINGRRIEDEGFLVTIPKFNRPFWDIYLYTAKFVGPDDRIEIFYVPYEVLNINTEKEPVTFGTNGYIEAVRQNLEVPYDTNLYTYYVNGKKIPSTWLTGIDTSTLRVNQNTKTLKHLVVNKSYRDTIEDVVSYLKGSTYSAFDKLIQSIKDSTYLKYDELDNLFNVHVTMTDTEDDMIAWDTGPIAIINEIVRDFWVTSGYQYNDVVKFIYDYALDEYIELDEDNNFRVLPALDARQYINIQKNEIHFLYFTYTPEELILEIGSSLSDVIIKWEYSTPLYGDISVVTQYMNDELLDLAIRQYTDPNTYTSDVTYTLVANTISGMISKSITYHFYNGIYYGNIDEDSLQWFLKDDQPYLDDIFAVIPNNGVIPTSSKQSNDETLAVIKQTNSIIYDLTYEDGEVIEQDDPWDDPDLVNLNDTDLYAICDDCGNIDGPIEVSDGLGTPPGVIEYMNTEDLKLLIPRLDHCVYQDNVNIDLTDYIIGSNNYFVFAAPYRLCFKDGVCVVRFSLPDVTSDEVINHGYDDHTVPVYTDGRWDEQGQLIKLDTCEMVYMGEFSYTNSSGYTEDYCVWRTNGFFTRRYNDYGFDIKVYDKSIHDGIQTEFSDDDFE